MRAFHAFAGTFKILTKAGKLEKSVDAHRGAVIAVKWSPEGALRQTFRQPAPARPLSRHKLAITIVSLLIYRHQSL